MTGRVEVEQDGTVRTILITNPATRNALDDTGRRALLGALEGANADPGCRAVVLAGAGPTFCSGGDIASMPVAEAAIAARMGELHAILRQLVAGPTPIVTAIEGVAFGSGMSLVAASDHVVAASDARLCAPFPRLGLVADVGLLWTLPRRVGWGRARSLVLRATEVSGPEARDIGLADEVVAPGAARARAEVVAAELAGLAPRALAEAKRLLLAGAQPLAGFLDEELDAQQGLLATDDFGEGRAAFYERRPASFTGS
jgi:enoyl-CoA hydratase/carnithine racemase